ncbi:MAG: protein-glutamate O-methyltransferase CheR [Methanomicrobiales archaeon]|nr:protein-glutamate O-methyltransferase CheR [Methanomicrobiales archaeon]
MLKKPGEGENTIGDSMNRELHRIVKTMRVLQGCDISCYDEPFLSASLEKRMAATSLATVTDYCDYLSGNADEAEQFFRSLNITYSEFFRNPLTFAVLEQQVLPRLIEEKQDSCTAELRVWSAGCAAGQESYSVAILLDELLVARKSSLSFRIFATDISGDSLVTAGRGVYDTVAVQNVRLKHLQSCFETGHGSYTVSRRLIDRIEFSSYDLLDERSTSPPGSIYGDFDLVFCSNLLFYYKPEVRQFIINKVCHSLSYGGYMVTGEAERGIVDTINLEEIFPMSAVYRKIKECQVMV